MAKGKHCEYALYFVTPWAFPKKPIEIGPLIYCSDEHLKDFKLSRKCELDGINKARVAVSGGLRRTTTPIGVWIFEEEKRRELVGLDVPRYARDALSLCCATEAARSVLTGGFSAAAYYSDPFTFFPAYYDNGETIVITDQGRSLTTENKHPSLTIPWHFQCVEVRDSSVDHLLLEACDKALWRFVRGKSRRMLRQVFRSIGMASHARKAFPEDVDSLWEVGKRAVDWVSAFEILINDQKNNVSLDSVLKHLGKIVSNKYYDPTSGKILPSVSGSKRFRPQRRSGRKKKGRDRTNGYGKIYSICYQLRNDAIHGNVLKRSRCYFGGESGCRRIDRIMPLVYREALIIQLRKEGLVPGFRRLELLPAEFKNVKDVPIRSWAFHEAFEGLFREK